MSMTELLHIVSLGFDICHTGGEGGAHSDVR